MGTLLLGSVAQVSRESTAATRAWRTVGREVGARARQVAADSVDMDLQRVNDPSAARETRANVGG